MKKLKNINARITEDEHAELATIVKILGIDSSTFMRTAVLNWKRALRKIKLLEMELELTKIERDAFERENKSWDEAYAACNPAAAALYNKNSKRIAAYNTKPFDA